jgi:hypothetical protein
VGGRDKRDGYHNYLAFLMTDISPADEPVYQERYCALVDILAFSEVIARLADDPAQYKKLRNLLTRVYSPMMADPHLFHHTDFRAQSISDAVAISTTCTTGALSQLLFSLQQLALDLLMEGFFARGALVKGFLYHDDNMVFGPALIRAHQLVSGRPISTNHDYPRCYCRRCRRSWL